jgi:hypothetical protein
MTVVVDVAALRDGADGPGRGRAELGGRCPSSTELVRLPRRSCGRSRATPRSGASSCAGGRSPSTWAGGRRWSLQPSGRPSWRGIRNAGSRGATGPTRGATPTTSGTGRTEDRRRCPTWSCCADATTAWSISAADSDWSSKTANQSSEDPTGPCCAMDHCRWTGEPRRWPFSLETHSRTQQNGGPPPGRPISPGRPRPIG